MDRSRGEDRYTNRRQRESNPSFSSTLLDAIYRSIDEGGGKGEEELVLYRETMRKTRSNCTAAVHGGGVENDEEMANIRRACLIEKWMEKKVSEKVVVRRKSAADFERKSRSTDRGCLFLNSSSSSSDSSSGGGFSSSEAESTGYGLPRPKPIRTSVSVEPKKTDNQYGRDDLHMFDSFPDRNEQKAKHQSGLVKTKSKAMKIYGDLKKVKQPISPGGRLASFLNSLFTAGNAKKAKISSSTGGGYTEKHPNQSKYTTKSAATAYSSTCSSASSFSRSCLSKTPSSRGTSNNGVKRSVRFCPVNVVVGEDLQPCEKKSLNKDDPKSETVNRNFIRDSIDGELKLLIMEKNRRVEEVARDLLKNYQKKVECEINMRNIEEFDDDDDEDDDVASCDSSDLFELDNLSAIGIERYREELPVYETTHLGTNRAIANGLIC